MLKTRIIITRLLIFCMALFFVLASSCDRSEESSTNNIKGDIQEMDRLFQEADVLRIQDPGEPLEIILNDMNGRERKLSDFRGKIIFLNFWATWCLPCRKEMPSMERLYKRFRDKDFEMIGINMQEPASSVKEFFENYKFSFISLLDSTGDVQKRFGIRAIPSTLILDKKGRIIGKAIGEKEWDRKEAIDLFRQLVEMKIEE